MFIFGETHIGNLIILLDCFLGIYSYIVFLNFLWKGNINFDSIADKKIRAKFNKYRRRVIGFTVILGVLCLLSVNTKIAFVSVKYNPLGYSFYFKVLMHDTTLFFFFIFFIQFIFYVYFKRGNFIHYILAFKPPRKWFVDCLYTLITLFERFFPKIYEKAFFWFDPLWILFLSKRNLYFFYYRPLFVNMFASLVVFFGMFISSFPLVLLCVFLFLIIMVLLLLITYPRN